MKKYISSQDNIGKDSVDTLTHYQYLESQINEKLRLKNGALAPVFSERYKSYYNNNIELINDIISSTSFIQRGEVSFKERVYCIENRLIQIPPCLNCGKPTTFIRFKYQECCSRGCANILKTGKYVGVNNPSRLESYYRLYELIKDNLLTPIEEYIDRITPIQVSCKRCGEAYASTMVKEINKKESACCKKCDSSISQPILDICSYLSDNNISYVIEHRFKGCVNPRTGYTLPFDIYLPEKDVIIEYDGPHHTTPVYGEDSLINTKYRDNIKNEWCIENNKTLLRIPYTIHNHVSYVHSFLQNISPKYEIYTNSNYNNDIIELRDYIESFGYSDYIIFGIYRGSLQPAVHLSNVTNSRKNIGIIQFQSYDGNDKTVKILCEGGDIDKNTAIFVIDDIYDTGNTINKVKKKMKYKYKHNNIHYVTLFGKPNDEGVYYVRENKNFVIFPWETITDTRCKVCNHSEPCRNNLDTHSHCNLKNKSFINQHTCSDFKEK